MQNIERGGYSRDEILDALHARHNSRNVRFRYDLLDRNEYFIKTLSSVVSGEVSMSALSTIKRTAKFTVREEMIPEHYERANDDRVSVTWNTTSHWNTGTFTNTVVTGTNVALSTPATSTITDPDFETSGWTSGLNPNWTGWGTNVTFAKSSAHTYGGTASAQSITRTGTGSIGFRTNAYPITVAVGDKINVAFLFKLVSNTNGNFTTPNYVYAYGNGVGNQQFSSGSATITSLGSSWYRYENELTSTIAGSYGLLIGWNTSTGVDGTASVDFVYFQKNNPPVFTGEWISPPKDISGNSAIYQDSLITTSESDQRSGDVIFYSRLSFDYGATWTSWSNEGNSSINNLTSNVTKLDYAQVQFKAVFNRNTVNITDCQLVSLSFWLDKEIEVLVPETPEIDYLQHRIKPYMEVRMGDGNWVEFPLGVFLLQSPTRSDENGQVYRDIDAYDGTIVLDEDKFSSRYFIAGGTKYTKAVQDILATAGITKVSIQDTARTVKASGIEFPTGTSKLEAINSLLDALNYTPLWVDAEGYYTTYAYVSPSDRGIDYTYEDNELSVIFSGIEQELDLDVPNSWVAVQSNAESTPLVSRKTNSNPDSPTSTISRGRTITDFREVNDIADQATLDDYVNRIAFEASQVYGSLKFKTALMPFHEYADVLQIVYGGLDINDSFSETSWKMNLVAGGEMEHEVRKVVEI